MEFFRNSKIDFMGMRRVFLVLSLLAMTAAVVAIFVRGQLNIGIDFAGGTQLTMRFAESPDLETYRGVLSDGGFDGAVLQRFGDEELNEVMVRTAVAEEETGGSRGAIEKLFDAHFGQAGGSKIDLNRQGRDALQNLLYSRDPEGLRPSDGDEAAREYYTGVADAVMTERERDGLLDSFADLDGVEAVNPQIRSFLEAETETGAFSIIAAENVGPQIGKELRRRGIQAVLFAVVGMLLYIWLRFEFRFGVGAVAAIVHDVLITLGIYAVANYEFNLTTIAAFLTVVGYSVNDTVVVFDRVRENLRRSRRLPLAQVLNTSLNQTLSRTVLTSGTTLLAVSTLYALGGEVIRGFSFVLMIGVVIGTYSSIFVASPIVLIWEHFFGRDAKVRRASGKPAQTKERDATA